MKLFVELACAFVAGLLFPSFIRVLYFLAGYCLGKTLDYFMD